jgi:hypothetical protein
MVGFVGQLMIFGGIMASACIVRWNEEQPLVSVVGGWLFVFGLYYILLGRLVTEAVTEAIFGS